MDNVTAEVILRSFVGRLVAIPDGFRLPEGRLSCDEVIALRLLSGEQRLPQQQVAGPATGVGEQVELDVSAVDRAGPAEESLRLCLDFGTALSKAWAIGQTVRDTIPLVLGRYSGLGETLTVPSSIFVSDNGRIFFGGAAEIQHRQELEHGRKRFDNLKRMLSDAEVNQDLDHVALPSGIDPTGSGLTRGDLLVLYLAWVTDLALQALEDHRKSGAIPTAVSEEELRCVRRRFAIPCFAEAEDSFTGGSARALWAEGVLARSIMRAQIVADTLRGQWDSLDTIRAKAVVDSVRRLRAGELPQVLTTVPSVREPIAAGASLFDEELEELQEHQEEAVLSRRYLMVVDAGAGTTDFAVFQVFSGSETQGQRYALLSGSVRMSRVAGNAIDEVLRPLILRACGIDPATGAPRGDEDFALIKTDLAAQIRAIKESLFIHGVCDVQLRPNARGTLAQAEIEADSAYASLAGDLKSQCQAILGGLFQQDDEYRALLRRGGLSVPVHVLLTGGSSQLPIVQGLADTTLAVDGIKFRLKRVRSLPDWINQLSRESAELVGRTYPQSAVSIGGASRELPVELPPFAQPVVPPPPGERRLATFPTRGV